MKKENKKFAFFSFLIASIIYTINFVKAHCPICTAAVGSGLVATRFLGVDDAISGLWIGAFIISTALWLDKLARKKFKPLPFQTLFIAILSLAATIIPFHYAGVLDITTLGSFSLQGKAIDLVNVNSTASCELPQNSLIFGIDRLLFGILLGFAIAWLVMFLSSKLIEKKGLLFPFQTIVLTVLSLIITSLILWLLL